MDNTKRICINVDKKLLEKFDQAVKYDYRSTRTEAILALMRKYINEVKDFQAKPEI